MGWCGGGYGMTTHRGCGMWWCGCGACACGCGGAAAAAACAWGWWCGAAAAAGASVGAAAAAICIAVAAAAGEEEGGGKPPRVPSSRGVEAEREERARGCGVRLGIYWPLLADPGRPI